MIQTVLKIRGMSCPMCEAHVRETLRDVCPSAKKVSADYRKETATIISEEPVDATLIKTFVDKTGYEVLSWTSCTHQAPGLIKKLAVLFK